MIGDGPGTAAGLEPGGPGDHAGKLPPQGTGRARLCAIGIVLAAQQSG